MLSRFRSVYAMNNREELDGFSGPVQLAQEFKRIGCRLGASMCALQARRSVATTMGFSALDGLPVGHRCGALDPGVVLYLIVEKGMDTAAIADLLYNRSGLLGVSGISGDMRKLSASKDPHAAEAIQLFVYRIGRELGSLVAAQGGLDVLVFTGGIGQCSAAVREQVCRDAAWLGIELDSRANTAGGPCITRAGSRVSAWVIPTDEDLTIARHTVKLIGAANNVLSLAIAVRSVRCTRRIFLPVKAVDPQANGRSRHRQGPLAGVSFRALRMEFRQR
jgi:acetate kinase